MTDNPLLDLGDPPAFDRIRPEHIAPAMQVLLSQAEAALAQATSPGTPADYDTLSAVLDVATERLQRRWGVVSHLKSVLNTPELRAAFNEALPAVTAFHTALGASQPLYEKYKAVAVRAEALTPARRHALTLALREFVLSGAELQGAARERFTQIQARKAELSQRFSEHVLDATDGFALDVDESRLDGLPPDAQAAARAAAQAAGLSGGRLTLQGPSYIPAMQHLADREARQALYTAYMTRASEIGPAALDNTAIVRELLQLRAEEANLLGHANHAEVSLARKMASTPQQVVDFMRDLARRARPQALKDLAELRTFAATELGLAELQPWDVPYAAERLRERRYAYSAQEVQAYFTLPRVLQGLFGIIETLFEVTIREAVTPVWHDSVRFFRIERRAETSDGAPTELAHFYLDLFARPGKRPGAWMDSSRARWLRPDGRGLQIPVANLVCNFQSPQGDQPALLTHDNVITLFHEFGHGLHHMLTAVQDLGVSGISGVEWDAVELPSQFMENFCWEWEVLRGMTAHVETGESMPRALFDKMLAARNFHNALGLLRQIEFALLDMRLHADPAAADHVLDVAQAVRDEVAVLPQAAFNRWPLAFSHIFAGGYAAGYYSYKWAEVLSADAFAAFQEAGVLDPATGRRYRREILESGGSRPAMDSFRAFRGREPSIDALLRHMGMQ